jgi:hypothetical protein
MYNLHAVVVVQNENVGEQSSMALGVGEHDVERQKAGVGLTMTGYMAQVWKKSSDTWDIGMEDGRKKEA